MVENSIKSDGDEADDDAAIFQGLEQSMKDKMDEINEHKDGDDGELVEDLHVFTVDVQFAAGTGNCFEGV